MQLKSVPIIGTLFVDAMLRSASGDAPGSWIGIWDEIIPSVAGHDTHNASVLTRDPNRAIWAVWVIVPDDGGKVEGVCHEAQESVGVTDC